ARRQSPVALSGCRPPPLNKRLARPKISDRTHGGVVMTSPLASIMEAGTKLWLDSVDPELVAANRALGATGATSNPIIISDLIKSGRYDDDLAELMSEGLSDSEVAWAVTDRVVS